MKISLNETYQQLLLEEEAKVMLIRTAIKNKWVVNIDYRGDGTIHAGKRDIEPVCLGITKAGNLAVRAWQIKGVTDTPENHPGWRLFRMDKITMVRSNKIPFKIRPKFNRNGDKSLIRILLLAKF